MSVFGAIAVGTETSFAKTFTEADLSFFCAISGDFDPIHVNEHHAAGTVFGRRIAHGLAVLGLLSAPEAEVSRKAIASGSPRRPVTLGYDRLRFLKPVYLGDTLTARYRIVELDEQASRSTAECTITRHNGTRHDGDLCVVGRHIMKWVG
jgi:3-hydroxybutyryl-CoA dehydratase